ncbi:MAG: class I SAM-dependent methyltransferase [Candidatus Eisenbacteria bacterium]|nr:class I SAM-dependent methyltransferase [Candidatus Eisenbacteria bacterium]
MPRRRQSSIQRTSRWSTSRASTSPPRWPRRSSKASSFPVAARSPILSSIAGSFRRRSPPPSSTRGGPFSSTRTRPEQCSPPTRIASGCRIGAWSTWRRWRRWRGAVPRLPGRGTGRFVARGKGGWAPRDGTFGKRGRAAEFYTTYAAEYERIYAAVDYDAQVDFLRGAVPAFRPHAGDPPQLRSLDLCCGTGRHAAALVRRGWRTTACDLSPAMTVLTRAKSNRIRVARADLRALPFRGPYDLVLCSCNALIESRPQGALRSTLQQIYAILCFRRPPRLRHHRLPHRPRHERSPRHLRRRPPPLRGPLDLAGGSRIDGGTPPLRARRPPRFRGPPPPLRRHLPRPQLHPARDRLPGRDAGRRHRRHPPLVRRVAARNLRRTEVTRVGAISAHSAV